MTLDLLAFGNISVAFLIFILILSLLAGIWYISKYAISFIFALDCKGAPKISIKNIPLSIIDKLVNKNGVYVKLHTSGTWYIQHSDNMPGGSTKYYDNSDKQWWKDRYNGFDTKEKALAYIKENNIEKSSINKYLLLIPLIDVLIYLYSLSPAITLFSLISVSSVFGTREVFKFIFSKLYEHGVKLEKNKGCCSSTETK